MDHYKIKLATAQFTWRECKVCPYHKRQNGRKDRVSGRADKRSARQAERRAIESEEVN